MPKKDRIEPPSEQSEVFVKLKPILGVRPGLYMTVLYALAAGLLVFFLLFYPGLRNRGQYLVATSYPGRATVKVDGVFAGTTPCTIFAKRGTRQIEVSRPYFPPATSELKIRGRVFATLIVPDRQRRSFTLANADAAGLAAWALKDYQANPNVPQIMSDAAWAAFKQPASREVMYDFLHQCMYFVSTESQSRELVSATARVATSGTVLSPLGLVSIVQKTIQVKGKYMNSPAWLLLSVSRENGKKIGAKPWVGQYLATYRESMAKYYEASFRSQMVAGGGSRGPVVGSVVFRSIPAGQLVMGNDEKLENLGRSIDQTLPHPIAVASFALGETEVTNRQFKAFLDENPDWQPSNRDALAAKARVTEQYLGEWIDGAIPAGREDHPVTGVSFNAASAYCQWLARKAASAAPGWVVRLPTEAEWEWAARGGLRGMPYPLGEKPGASVFFTKGATSAAKAGSSEPNGYGLRDMVGNVWEWCSDSFAPSAYLLTSLDPRENARLAASIPASADHVVRGGAWNNARDQVKVFTRGSQPADWCTPYLGFRVAMARP
jgi:gamma-glutamyl hercynylcysteine S-oxide synthase